MTVIAVTTAKYLHMNIRAQTNIYIYMCMSGMMYVYAFGGLLNRGQLNGSRVLTARSKQMPVKLL